MNSKYSMYVYVFTWAVFQYRQYCNTSEENVNIFSFFLSHQDLFTQNIQKGINKFCKFGFNNLHSRGLESNPRLPNFNAIKEE